MGGRQNGADPAGAGGGRSAFSAMRSCKEGLSLHGKTGPGKPGRYPLFLPRCGLPVPGCSDAPAGPARTAQPFSFFFLPRFSGALTPDGHKNKGLPFGSPLFLVTRRRFWGRLQIGASALSYRPAR